MKIKEGVYILENGNLIIIKDLGEHYACQYDPKGIWNIGTSYYAKFGNFSETKELIVYLKNSIYKGAL